MKLIVSTLLVLSVFVLMLPARGNVAEIEPFGFIGAFVGAERETGIPHNGVGRAGGRGTIDALGVLPFGIPNFGLQASVQYVGGQGSRFAGSAGPIYAFPGGKTGFFLEYQRRTLRDADFFWLNPVLALYFDQANVNLSYQHPISGVQKLSSGDGSGSEDTEFTDVATNKFQGTVSYFPQIDLGFVRKDNLELTFGVQVNTFTGHDTNHIRSAGVGPVVGVSAMPWQNLEVNLFRVTADNRSRYQVNSGVRYFFTSGGEKAMTLKEVRRKYLEAGPGPVGGFTRGHSTS
jgi:hypothetical protein